MSREKPESGNRRLIQHGGSVGITLPKSWLDKKGWKVGDKVGLVFDDVAVIVRPKFEENAEGKPEEK